MDIVALLRAIADVAESNNQFRSAILSAMAPFDTEPKKCDPIFKAAQWPIQSSTIEWIESRWPGIDYQVPLQKFIDYWGGTGKLKTAKNWELTLRKNPPFASEMNKKAMEGIGNDHLRARAREVYIRVHNGETIHNTTPETNWLVQEGHCHVEGTILRSGQSPAR